MKNLPITKNLNVFEICVKRNIVCATDLNFSLTMDDLKQALEQLPITEMETKEMQHIDFDAGIQLLTSNRNHYAKDIATPRQLLEQLNQCIPKVCQYDGNYDLQHYLPNALKAISNMTYIGASHSGTPFHMDQGGSPGHNCMVYAEPNAYAEWYLVDNSMNAIVEKNMKKFNHENKMRTMDEITTVDIEISQHTTEIEIDLTNFDTHILNEDEVFIAKYKEYLATNVFYFKQLQGFFIFIPPGTMHQVHNFGLSAKIAWNIITPHSCLFFFDKLQAIYSLQQRPQVYRHDACLMYYIHDFQQQYSKNPVEYATNMTLYEFNRLYSAMQIFEEELFQLYMPLTDDVIYKQCHQPIEQALDIVCDKCRADIFLFSFHCNCQNTEILKSLHQSIKVKHTDGFDYCVRCFGNMSDKERHCDDMILQSLFPVDVFHAFSEACESFERLAKHDKFIKQAPMSSIAPRHELFKVDETIHKTSKRPGYAAMRRYLHMRRKRKSTILHTELPVSKKSRAARQEMAILKFTEQVRANEQTKHLKIGIVDRTSSPEPSVISVFAAQIDRDEDGESSSSYLENLNEFDD